MTGILAPLRGIKNHLLKEIDIPSVPTNLRRFINGEQVGAGKFEKQVRGRDGVEILGVVSGLVSSIRVARPASTPVRQHS